MKKMSKLFSIAVAAVMTLCLCSFGVIFTASANTYTLTINKPTPNENGYSFANHRFIAYKVFAAIPNADNTAFTYSIDDECLDNTNKAGYGDSQQYKPDYSSITTDKVREFAEYLNATYFGANAAKSINTHCYSAQVDGTAEATSLVINVTQAGYYLIADSYMGANQSEETAMSLVMLGTSSGNTSTINLKADAATQFNAKDVKDDSAWRKYTDSETGKDIEFRLKIKTPSASIANYTSAYTYKVDDTLDASLDYVADSVKVCTDEACETPVANVISSAVQTDRVLTITFNDLRSLYTAGTLLPENTYYIYYKAAFSGASAKYAVQASDTDKFNLNAAQLSYSTDPYDAAEITQTVAQSAYVWTYGFNFKKVMKSAVETGLSGAVFNVYRGSVADANLMKFSVNTSGAYYVDPSASGNADITVSAADGHVGEFTAYGFDDATTYILVEKTPPEGYSAAESATFKVDAVNDVTGALTGLTKNISGLNIVPSDLASGTYSGSGSQTVIQDIDPYARIWNSAGQELIGTGGIGTTIFYVAGGILMAGALILLITKLRMKNKD